MVCITRDRLDGIGRVSRDRLQVPVEGAVTEEPRDILLDDARRVELRGLSIDRREVHVVASPALIQPVGDLEEERDLRHHGTRATEVHVRAEATRVYVTLLRLLHLREEVQCISTCCRRARIGEDSVLLREVIRPCVEAGGLLTILCRDSRLVGIELQCTEGV